MSDYRLECCGGFPSHLPGCDVDADEHDAWMRAVKETKEKKAREEEYWSSMSDEQIFAELAECRKQIKANSFWVNRHNSGTDYLRKYGKISAYLDSLRSSESKEEK